jgi:hypothetical protein
MRHGGAEMDRVLASAAANLKHGMAAVQQITQCSKNRLAIAGAGGGKWLADHADRALRTVSGKRLSSNAMQHTRGLPT